MSQDLKGRRVAILVTDGFEQIELTSPRQALEAAGATCTIISPVTGTEVQGFKHHDKAEKLKVGLALSKAEAADFDAVLLPGGVINGDALRIEKKAQQFVQEMDRAGKPIMVICHGGWLLVSAGLVKGRTMTSWPTLRDDIQNAGGIWKDEQVIRDGHWVSSRKPDDLPAFNDEIVKAAAESRGSQGARRAGNEERGRDEVRG
jgi:protease I